MATRFHKIKGRRFNRGHFQDCPRERTYNHAFYLSDAHGCIQHVIRWNRDPKGILAICPSWNVNSAKAGSWERLSDAARTFPKIGNFLP